MLYYGDRARSVPLETLYQAVLRSITDARDVCRRGGSPAAAKVDGHSMLVDAAITLGQLHQAVADHLSPTLSEVSPKTDALARAGVLLGRCVYRSSLLLGLLAADAGQCPSGEQVPLAPSIASLLRQATEAVERVAPSLPAGPIEVRLPEGYAYYALYPEMYFASLKRALRDQRPRRRYAVLGIRSIGSSLAPLVAGALAEMGFGADVETVRPGGHAFDRQLDAGPGLRARLERWAGSGAGFILVDEGPGLSCSSFLSVCSLLEGMGVPEERIAILAAWQGAPGQHSSPELRARWERARVYHTPASEQFDGWRSLVPLMERCLSPGDGISQHERLELVKDVSYGRWMEHLQLPRDGYPPVNRSGERIKLLLRRLHTGEAAGWAPGGYEGQGDVPRGGESEESYLIAKFGGLGQYGQARLSRARALASAGLSPEVLAYCYGFLIYRFMPGRPLTRRDLAPSMLDRMVDYYAFLVRSSSKPPEARFDRLAETVTVNARKGLGADASGFVARWRPEREAIDHLPLVLLDGRPQPHEWVEVAVEGKSVVLKTDSADHAEDHTIVGEQSILWDLAGSWEEWRMRPEDGEQLLWNWERKTGDGDAARLIDFYRVAYLAFRLGGMHYAIGAEPDDCVRQALKNERAVYAERMLDLLRETAPRRRQHGLAPA